ncbi:hypothetical protein [Haloarcula marismortui]|nr:hypothetical protein [Haloarcula californiae]
MTSEQTCLRALREATKRVGHPPTMAEYDELGLIPSSVTINDVVGWDEAKEQLGLDTVTSGAVYTDEDLIAQLRVVTGRDETNEPLQRARYEYLRTDDEPVAATIQRRFGGWDDAYKRTVAPLPETEGTDAKYRIYSQSEIDEWVSRAARACGEPLSMDAYNEWREDHPDAPGADTIDERYTWAATLIRNDIHPERKRGQTIDDLLGTIIRIRVRTGDWPTADSYREHKYPHEPSPTWFYDNYSGGIDSWSGVIATAKQQIQQFGRESDTSTAPDSFVGGSAGFESE